MIQITRSALPTHLASQEHRTELTLVEQLAAAEKAFQQVPLVRTLGDVETNRRYERTVAALSRRLEMAKRRVQERKYQTLSG